MSATTYIGSQPWPFPRSLMLGFFAEASSTEITIDDVEIVDARWFTRTALADLVVAWLARSCCHRACRSHAA